MNLWGLHWIFLKDDINHRFPTKKKKLKLKLEKDLILKTPEHKSFKSPIASAAKNIESFEKLSPSARSAFKFKSPQEPSYREYRSPQGQLDSSVEATPRSNQRFRESRTATVKVRRMVLPPKNMPRVEELEDDTCFNRRKHYGKWYLPPKYWKKGLDDFKSSLKADSRLES